MKRFLLVLALIAVAGATYVATAPGSQTATGPTLRQFRALKHQVAVLKSQMKIVKFVLGVDTKVLTDCMATSKPINQFGDDVNHTKGYWYSDPAVNSGDPVDRGALDYTANDDPSA